MFTADAQLIYWICSKECFRDHAIIISLLHDIKNDKASSTFFLAA